MNTLHIRIVLLMFTCLWGCTKNDDPVDPKPLQEIVEYKVMGSATDSGINDVIENDSVVGPSEGNHAFLNLGEATKINTLFLFFPGTNSLPSWHKGIGTKAAEIGYHALVMRYNSIVPIFTICGNSTDPDCHEKARLEVLTGEDLNNDVFVDRANSIENRVVKLLQYLDTSHPEQGWGQYLLSTSEVDWAKVVVSGHSQGGGYAGLIAKRHSVRRSVMFSASDWYQGAPAPWVTAPGQTPASKIYAFVHVRDEAGFFGPSQIMLKNWEGYGIDILGEIVNVDTSAFPYGDSHTLVTNAETVDYSHWFHDDRFHNGVVVDPFVPIAGETYLYDEVWEYMLSL